MPALVRLFLSGGLTEHKIDGDGRPDKNDGTSDREVLLWFKHAIEEIAGARIEVTITSAPVTDRISTEVKQSINRSDAMLCVFTKRSEDGLLHKWTTSPYVLAESGFGAGRFTDHASDRPRLFAFVEEGVDPDQLGLAFPRGDRVYPAFRRNRLPECLPKLQEIVEKMVHADSPRPAAVQPIILHKTVSVWRSGGVLAETLYRFRLNRVEHGEVRIPHTLWRISQRLPSFDAMCVHSGAVGSGSDGPFLRCLVRRCGDMPANDVRFNFDRVGSSHHGNEIRFDLVFRNVAIEPGQQLEYLLLWAYPDAFHHPRLLPKGQPNSVGLRTGGRGPVADVTMILKFQRDWSEMQPRTIEEGPDCFVHNDATLPAAVDPLNYWHDPRHWSDSGRMFRQVDSADGVFDVFIWNRSNFSGQLKVTWAPGENYHPCPSGALSAAVPTLMSAAEPPAPPSSGSAPLSG